jgi:hypothetical protein
VNWYRALWGLPAVGEPAASANARAQEAALIMAAQGSLSHWPDPSWACYSSAGSDGAGRSLLALGPSDHTAGIDQFMFDWGNETTLGHRRWLMYPGLMGSGYGYVSDPGSDGWQQSALALVAFDEDLPNSNATTDEPLAYPPAGAFPAALASSPFAGVVPFSLTWRDADFSWATVSMAHADGSPIGLQTSLRVMEPNYGDNTAMWIPDVAPRIGEVWVIRVEGTRFAGIEVDAVSWAIEWVDCGAELVF